MVLHAGQDGQLSYQGHANHYIFEWNSYELQSLIDLGQGERIPTLEQVI